MQQVSQYVIMPDDYDMLCLIQELSIEASIWTENNLFQGRIVSISNKDITLYKNAVYMEVDYWAIRRMTTPLDVYSKLFKLVK